MSCAAIDVKFEGARHSSNW